MRSGTSFFNWTVFKKTVTRFWPIWAAYLAFWVIVLPINGLMRLRRITPEYNPWEYFAPGLGGTLQVMLPMMLGFGCIAAMAVFSHLYNHRSANFFGSLPVRREGLFLTHYLAGLCFFIVPNVIVALLTLAVEAVGGFVVPEVLGYWLLVACVEGLFFYTFALFCGMFAGHILALPAFYGIFNGLFIAIYYTVQMVLREFYYGFSYMSEGMNQLVQWFTPIYRLYQVQVEWEYVGDSMTDRIRSYSLLEWKTLAVYVVAALVLVTVSFLLYRVRRLESAADVVAVKSMRPVFKYSVSFCAGLFLGHITAAVLGSGHITRMVCIVFWAVVGCFVAQMILDKSFRVFRKWKGPAVMAAVFCALFLVIAFDLTGFETRIPDPANVASVEVDGLSGPGRFWDDGDYVDLKLTDPAQIGYLVRLHQEAVAQRDWEDDPNLRPNGGEYVSLRLTYHLKSGGTMSRSYSVWIMPDQVEREDSAAWALEQLYADRDLYWQAYGFDKIHDAMENGGRLDGAYYYFYNERNDGSQPEEQYEYFQGNDLYFSSRDALALMNAVEQDFRDGNIGVRHVNESDNVRDGEVERTLSFHYTISTATGRYGDSLRIYVSDTAEHTLALLYELMPEAIAEMDDEQGSTWGATSGMPSTEMVVDAVPTQVPVPTDEPIPSAAGVE